MSLKRADRVRWTDILGRPTDFGSGLTDEQAAIIKALLAVGTGVLVRTSSGFVVRSIVRSGNGLRVENSDGLGGNPTIALADDVAAIESLSGSGFLQRLGANLWQLSELAAVALTGEYADLSGTPALAAVALTGDYADLTGRPILAAVALSGDYADLSGTPTLAAVATSGAYADLSGTPTVRSLLTANRTYYVATTGSNGNDGLTSGTPFLTIQFAIDTLANLDTQGYNVVVQVADGTYAENVTLKLPLGSGTLTLRGNTTTPANVIISPASGSAITHDIFTARWTCEGLRVAVAGASAVGVLCNSGKVTLGVFSFGACTRAHMEAVRGGRIDALGNYTINGGAQWHLSSTNAIILTGGNTVTLTGTPAFSSAFARAATAGTIGAFSITYSGSATGKRYDSTLNSVIDTNGAGASFFPGSVAGTTATGGQYN